MVDVLLSFISSVIYLSTNLPGLPYVIFLELVHMWKLKLMFVTCDV